MRFRESAGLVMYRVREQVLEVLLAHPGGPLFQFRDAGYWSIPKGEIEAGEMIVATAVREFKEEVGMEVSPAGPFLDLGSIRQKGGKIVHAWGVQANGEIPSPLPSNTFPMEWPPNSGRWQEFPEMDRAAFFPLAEAKTKIKSTQIPLLERLEILLRQAGPTPS
jgi:predicted NUDIX family NTP pyrophosphohydrolase